MSSSFLLFGTSSRKILISKCVLNTEMRIAIYLNAEKYPCSCRVGSFIDTLKKLSKILTAMEKKTFTLQIIITILRTSVLIHVWQFL